MKHPMLCELPESLSMLTDLALDLRWTWNHASDALWAMLDSGLWARTRNPWLILQSVSQQRLDALAADQAFMAEYEHALQQREAYLHEPTWWDRQHPGEPQPTIAYFSMEYGIGEPLPIYSGGLGVLAGDHLKTASDLGVPLVAVGLLYQAGYFRQMLDAHGRQLELHPVNLPYYLPIRPIDDGDGLRLTVPVELPGRVLRLKVWLAQVGRIPLYLLDSNDPLNTPADRGVTGVLYGGDLETRLAQEIVLGVGGWRALAALGIRPDVCHLNEGHAALLTIERARAFMNEHSVSFAAALWATRAGNVFTTHTPVAAAFDTFAVDLLAQYGHEYAAELDTQAQDLLGLGRAPGGNEQDLFNMAYLAARTCTSINAVSRLHGEVSRRIFQPLFPRVPESEVPVGHVTNGVHMASWDSATADALWTQACGKDRWMGANEALAPRLQALGDEVIWRSHGVQRAGLVHYARRRLAAQLGQRGADRQTIERAEDVLDPNALTLGFARRFTEYKRPHLLLSDAQRLARLLKDRSRPVQLIVAGKAHARDTVGKDIVQQWAEFTRREDVAAHAVFLEDYDMALAVELVQGVDVWINTPPPAVGGVRHERHEGARQRWAQPVVAGRLVGRGVFAGSGLGHRRHGAGGRHRRRADAVPAPRRGSGPHVLRPRRSGRPATLDRPDARQHGAPGAAVRQQPHDVRIRAGRVHRRRRTLSGTQCRRRRARAGAHALGAHGAAPLAGDTHRLGPGAARCAGMGFPDAPLPGRTRVRRSAGAGLRRAVGRGQCRRARHAARGRDRWGDERVHLRMPRACLTAGRGLHAPRGALPPRCAMAAGAAAGPLARRVGRTDSHHRRARPAIGQGREACAAVDLQARTATGPPGTPAGASHQYRLRPCFLAA